MRYAGASCKERFRREFERIINLLSARLPGPGFYLCGLGLVALGGTIIHAFDGPHVPPRFYMECVCLMSSRCGH